MNRYSLKTAALELVMVAVGCVFLFPLYMLTIVALRKPGTASDALVLRSTPTFQNFVRAWTDGRLGDAMLASATVTIVSVTVLVITGSLAAYAVVRSTSRLSNALFWTMMIGLVLPFQLAMIPLYRTMVDLGLVGSMWSLLIYYSGQQIPFTVFLYSGFIRALPRDYEEASWIDGASILGGFRHIVFPLLRPITGTVIILNVIQVWNDFFTPLLYLSGSDWETIPVALYSFVGQFTSNWPVVFSGLIIGIAPILIGYFFMQKKVITGFASGLKG